MKQVLFGPSLQRLLRQGLINAKTGDLACDEIAERVYQALLATNTEVLYDDRDERGGSKFADMDLISLPWQLIIGAKSVANGAVEIKNRKTGMRDNLPSEKFVIYA